MTAAETYAARIDAVNAQNARTRGERSRGDRWSGAMAKRFRADPHRTLDANLEAIASYIRTDDVLIDVGGGAGRLGLPLALRCRELIDVDPSSGMRQEFEESMAEAGINNARFVPSGWLEAGDTNGDVVLAANVTYFVREIVPFIRKLESAARRRVIVQIASPPPPMMNANLALLVFGEEQELVPGQPDLLPVLWELGILPDVRVLPEPFTGFPDVAASREEAIGRALQMLEASDEEAARRKLEEHFDELFGKTEAGFEPLWRPVMRQLLITWEPRAAA